MVKMESSDLSRMNKVLRHRLRNLAAGIKSSIVLLSKELEDKISPDLLEYFPLVAAECDSISELTNRMNLLFDSDLRCLSAPNVTSLHPSDTIAHVIREMEQTVRARYPYHRLRSEGSDAVMDLVLRDRRALSASLREVVANACEASSGGEVVVAVEQTCDNLVFRVSDHGQGIAHADYDKVFLPFYTTKSRQVGIGLSIAERLVETRMRGQINVSPNSDGGVTVELVVVGQTETMETEE